MKGQIAYIMSRFPHLPETFILREMIALEELGWQIEPYPLIVQKQAVVHEEAEIWLQRIHKISWISLSMVISNLKYAVMIPRKYLSTLFFVVKENISSINFLVRALLIFPKAVHMAEMIKKKKISHVHAHYATHPALAAWIIYRLTNITYSVTVHAHDIFVDITMLKTKIKSASFIASISEFNKNYLAERIGLKADEKIKIVHCGISPDNYHRRLPKERNDRFEIVCVGSLQPYKGQSYLIDACSLLHKRGLPFHCRIVGGGELYSELKTQITQLHLDSYIELLGPKKQSEVSKILVNSDCYVQPSIIMPSGKMEGIPVALMEAMASCLPVVATSISGIPELVRPEETGWLVPPNSALDLADSLFEIYLNSQEANRRAQNGYELVLREFDLKINALKLSNLFEEIVRPNNDNFM